MMKLNRAEHFLSEANYLGERDVQVRHGLIDGQANAMTGVSDYHNKLSDNTFFIRNIYYQVDYEDMQAFWRAGQQG